MLIVNTVGFSTYIKFIKISQKLIHDDVNTR